MLKSFLLLFLLYGALRLTCCTPQRPVRRIINKGAQRNLINLNDTSKAVAADKHSEILQQKLEINENGAYRFNFKTTNGISGKEEGQAGLSAQGTTSYTSPEGVEIMLTYTADETGYHPIGKHIPEIPAYILRGLAYIREHPFEVRRRYTYVPEIEIEPLVAPPLSNTKSDNVLRQQAIVDEVVGSKIKEATTTTRELQKLQKTRTSPNRGSRKYQQVL